ncbi:MAG TPA: hypothetical protein DCX46_01580 [Bacteroidetes bacterium]|nr:hypothetical protein [Bacteroidota bacterium]
MLGNLHKAVITALGSALLAGGCGTSGGAAGDDSDASGRSQTREGQKRSLAYYESTLRPSDFDEEIEVVRKVHEEEQRQQELLIPRDSLVLQEEQILGFRIQILSSSNVDDATAGKLAAQMVFRTDTVYVVYDPPVYKVRLGDFHTRLEANQKLSQVHEQGYPDAWVVPDRVIRRRMVSAGEQ